MGHGSNDDGLWWMKFSLATEDELAWRVVQELGFVLNYLSADERLPTVFMPVSPQRRPTSLVFTASSR